MPFRVGAEASTLRLVVLRWRPFLFFKLCLSRYFELCRLVSRLQIQHWLKIPTILVKGADGKPVELGRGAMGVRYTVGD